MIVVVTQRCTGCGACIPHCPEKAIEFYTENFVKKARCIEERCTGCGECVPHCGFDSIAIQDAHLDG